MFLYYFINYLLVLTILVSLCVPNSPKVVITTSTITAGTAAFNNILLI